MEDKKKSTKTTANSMAEMLAGDIKKAATKEVNIREDATMREIAIASNEEGEFDMLPEKFHEIFIKEKLSRAKCYTVWVSDENKRRLEAIKFNSNGKFGIRPTLNTILDMFFERYGVSGK